MQPNNPQFQSLVRVVLNEHMRGFTHKISVKLFQSLVRVVLNEHTFIASASL